MITLVLQEIENKFFSMLAPRRDAAELEELLRRAEGVVKVSDEVLLRARDYRCWRFGEIPLPAPLGYIFPTISSNGYSYKGELFVAISDKKDAERIVAKSKERLISKERGINREIKDAGRGLYVLCGEEPFFLISYDPVGSGSCRVQFGDSGTLVRRLTTIEQLETDLKGFCEVSSQLLNSFYDSPPDLKLYF